MSERTSEPGVTFTSNIRDGARCTAGSDCNKKKSKWDTFKNFDPSSSQDAAGTTCRLKVFGDNAVAATATTTTTTTTTTTAAATART